MLIIYSYEEPDDVVLIVAFQDARSSAAATATVRFFSATPAAVATVQRGRPSKPERAMGLGRGGDGRRVYQG